MPNLTNDDEAVREPIDVLAGEVDERDEGPGPVEAQGAGESETDSQHEEAMPKVVARDPGDPTQAEIDEHNVDHLPYRSWCECCVMGRGTGEQHRGGSESRVPVIAFDYLFVSQAKVVTRGEIDEEEAKRAPIKILLVKDTKSKTIFAHVVKHKGIEDDEYAVKRLVEDVTWLGYSKVILKCDGERAIVRLLRESLKRIKTDAVDASHEHPPTYDPKSNGAVENAVKQLKGHLRTIKLGLERNVGKRLPETHPLFTWLVEHAAWLLSTRVVGDDGQSAYQRVRGRPFGKRLVEFGERALYKLHMRGPHYDSRGAMEERWQRGIMLGFAKHSNQYILWDGKDVVQARTVQRMKRDSRWHLDSLEKVSRDVHSRYPAVGDQEHFGDDVEQPEKLAAEPRAPQGIAVRQADWTKFGSTPGCPKCAHADDHGWGKMGGPHSSACLERFERLLLESAAGRRRIEEAQKRKELHLKKMKEIEEQEPVEADAPIPQRFEEMENSAQIPLPAVPTPEWRDVPGGDEAPLTPGRELSENPRSPADPREDQDDAMDDRADDLFAPSDMEVETSMVCKDVCGAIGVHTDELLSETSARTPEMQELMTLVDDEARKVINDTDIEIMQLVEELGGGGKAYARERRTRIRSIVSEIYSPARVTRAIKLLPDMGLVAGFAFDLTNANEKGEPWDFSLEAKRIEATEIVEQQKPMMLIGSPMCTPYSALQALNKHKKSQKDIDEMMTKAKVHMDFVCSLYKLQLDGGRYFLHEHPATATSWELPCIKEILYRDGVDITVGDQCQYGQKNKFGEPLKKSTKWMSNSREVLRSLGKRCKGKGGKCSAGGTHGQCLGEAAKQAAVYPFKLCKAILEGFRNQLRVDRNMMAGVYGLCCDVEADLILQEQCEEWFNMRISEEINAVQGQPQYRDAITGQPMIPELVKAARAKELEYFASKGVWHYRPRSEALEKMGKPPITVKWVDVNKGDDIEPNYRSRLVAREIRKPGEESIFAPTPPLESLRTVLSMAATDIAGDVKHVRRGDSEDRTQVMVVDISRAYFNAKKSVEHNPTYVDLPQEDPRRAAGECGLLRVHMYGTRAAADGWHGEYSTTLIDLGFKRGSASACVFRHTGKRMLATVHGDDFTICGPKRHLDQLKRDMEEKYELTELARLGPGKTDDKEVKILNRIVRWTERGLEYEADPRQGEKIVNELGLAGASKTGTPGIKRTFEDAQSEKALPVEKHTAFRGVGARSNYLSADRPEIQFASKEICRFMASPTDQGVMALKRLGRFLEGRKRLIFDYPFQDAKQVEVYSDTDWSGCVKTRKSTSGGCMILGAHLIKSWSSTQSSISLSSGEAEFYGVVKATGIALGYQALLRDLEVKLPVRVWTDSTASMGICGRQGLGKLRHIDTRSLWVQQKVRSGAVELRKVRGEVNPADLFTKHLSSAERVESLLNLLGCRYADGRAGAAPKLRQEEGGGRNGSILACEMLYTADGPTVVENGYTYPAVQQDGVWIADAYMHDPAVLPHQIPGDLNLLFPKAVAAEEYPEVPEEADIMEHIGLRELEKGIAGNTAKGESKAIFEEFCDSVGSLTLSDLSSCTGSRTDSAGDGIFRPKPGGAKSRP